jgi:hypothetical protein
MDSEQLAQQLGIPWEQMWSELTYLEEKRYIARGSTSIGTRVFHSIGITALGIDFIENKLRETQQQNESFKVQLDIRNENEFGVRVISQTPMGEPSCISRLPYSKAELAVVLKAIGTRKYEADLFSPEQNEILKRLGLLINSHFVPDLLSSIGTTLYDALMIKDVDRAFQMVLNLVRPSRGKVALQLRFDEGSTELAHYPWELLFYRRALLPSGAVEMTRYITYAEAVTKLRVFPPLQLLYVQPRPTNLSFLDETEKALSEEALVKLQAEHVLKVDHLQNPTYEALLNYLETKSVHILHFDGHGVFAWKCQRCGAMNYPHVQNCQSVHGNQKCNESSVRSNGYLAFEQKDHKVDWISNEEISYLFGQHPIQLAVLSACRSSSIGDETLFSGVAPSLIQAGVPAVLSMQLPIRVSTAANFMLGFYRALAQFESLPAAVNAGRLRIVRTNEWFIPTLYLRSKDDEGLIFTRKEGE